MVRIFYLLLLYKRPAAISNAPSAFFTSSIPLCRSSLSGNKAASSNNAQKAVNFFPSPLHPFPQFSISHASKSHSLHLFPPPLGYFSILATQSTPSANVTLAPHLLFIFIRHDILMFRGTPLSSPRTHSLNIRRNELFIRRVSLRRQLNQRMQRHLSHN